MLINTADLKLDTLQCGQAIKGENEQNSKSEQSETQVDDEEEKTFLQMDCMQKIGYLTEKPFKF